MRTRLPTVSKMFEGISDNSIHVSHDSSGFNLYGNFLFEFNTDICPWCSIHAWVISTSRCNERLTTLMNKQFGPLGLKNAIWHKTRTDCLIPISLKIHPIIFCIIVWIVWISPINPNGDWYGSGGRPSPGETDSYSTPWICLIPSLQPISSGTIKWATTWWVPSFPWMR